jgi:RES domain-containing protein
MSPKWAFDPLNGAGAARHGGRWNRPGMPALYMSAEMATAFAEYHQDIPRPGTVCRFDVDVGPIVDLREANSLLPLGATEAELACAWKSIHLIARADPPTWRITDQLVAAGNAGILVPSAQLAGGTNLVLWRWNDAASGSVTAYDPQGDLPADQASWGVPVNPATSPS